MSGLYVGLMSGTSMDGIDAVLVELDADTPQLLNAQTYPWPEPLRDRLMRAAQGELLTADAFARLDADAGMAFADAAQSVISTHATARNIQAIGSHGQTLAHNPNASAGYSLQIGNPHYIVERTGMTTVADFRGRDIAAGGQGAPLVPAFHRAVFQHPQENRVVLNIGGIANLTWLPADTSEAVQGFDTGPGNCLMDAWINQHIGQRFDQNGDYARQGQFEPALLAALLADPYFALVPPKSTGTDYFSLAWLQNHLAGKAYRAPDVQASLLRLTAETITQSINQYYPDTDRVLVCGGGSHNTFLMAVLAGLLKCPVENTQNNGVHPDWVEAMAFAWLAQQHINKRSGNITDVTGAVGARVLGVLYPGKGGIAEEV